MSFTGERKLRIGCVVSEDEYNRLLLGVRLARMQGLIKKASISEYIRFCINTVTELLIKRQERIRRELAKRVGVVKGEII